MQYRVGGKDKLEFEFPTFHEPPSRNFNFNEGPHGGSLEFKNSNFNYSITEDARGLPLIFVDKDGKQVASVKCKDLTGGLLENSTLELFKKTGVTK